jgi:hypothetical protein
MNPDIKVRWVEALRSNNYKQAKGYLKTEDGFCCLGVLCDIAVQDGVIAAPIKLEGQYGEPDHYGYGSGKTGELPEEVADWAGLDSYNSLVREGESLTSLVELNDDYGYEFKQIAQLIEEQL